AYKSRPQAGGGIPIENGALYQAQVVAGRSYRPQVYAGDAALFLTRELAAERSYDQTVGWGKLVRGGLEIQDIPGNHATMMIEPHLRVLTKKLRARLIPK